MESSFDFENLGGSNDLVTSFTLLLVGKVGEAVQLLQGQLLRTCQCLADEVGRFLSCFVRGILSFTSLESRLYLVDLGCFIDGLSIGVLLLLSQEGEAFKLLERFFLGVFQGLLNVGLFASFSWGFLAWERTELPDRLSVAAFKTVMISDCLVAALI